MGLDIYHVKLVLPSASTLDYLFVKDFESNPSFLEPYTEFITNVGVLPDVGQVIYYEEKGCQRKRVAPGFLKAFESGKLYFRKEDIVRAKAFLKVDNPVSQLLLEQRFQRDFIDNFVEGESIFFADW